MPTELTWAPTSSLVVKTDGSPLSDELMRSLLSVSVEHAVDLPSTFTLTFTDPDRSIATKPLFKFGAKVDVSVQLHDDQGKLVRSESLIQKAEVTAFESEVAITGTTTIIRGFDASHRLHRETRTEIYQKLTYADIAQRVASRSRTSGGQIDASSGVVQHVVQWSETDWAFLNRIAREIGFTVAVRNGKLEFRNPKRPGGSRPVEIVPESLRQIRLAVTAAQQVKNVQVRSWSVATKKAVIGSSAVTAQQGNGEKPSQTLNGAFPSHETQRNAEVAAGSIAQNVERSGQRVEAIVEGEPRIGAGTRVTFKDLGQSFAGQHVVTAARHQFDEDGYTTWLMTGGPPQSGTLLGLIADASVGAGDRMSGVVPAVVTNLRDPDKACRVKVMFPWLSDKSESDWIRVAQPWSGNGYGAVLLPEVNDEVLVAFEHGALQRPYVIGCLYNGRDKPKEPKVPRIDGGTGKVNARQFVSRKGHSVTFIDQEGKDGIEIRTGNGKCRLEMDATTGKIVLDGQGQMEIHATQPMTIKSDANLKIESLGILELRGKTVKLNGDVSVEVRGAQVDVNGTAKADLKSAGPVTIQGVLVKIN